MLATILWLAGSALFFFDVSQFGTYNETYRSLDAIVALILWLFISSYAIIIGAALNTEMEFQTTRDTTLGPARPKGERDAVVAETMTASLSSS